MQRLLDIESRLLFTVARPSAGDAELRGLLDRGVDFGKLAMLAERERAIGPLWRRLSALEGWTPPAESDQVGTMAMVTEFQMQVLEQRLAEALDLLATRDIEVLLLKGAGLAVSIYPRFMDRPMWDLDLLIRPERAREAWRLLKDHGWNEAFVRAAEDFYETHHHHLPPLTDPAGVGTVLEVHRELMPGQSPFGFAAEDFWRSAADASFQGRSVKVPRLSHQIAHLSTHFAWSHMMDSAGWRTFRDLAWIVETEEVDWEELVDFAVRTRSGTCCYWALRLTRSLLGAPVPDEALRAMKPPGSAWKLDRLERVFALGLFPTANRRCPSVALFRVLWRSGIRPTWSGHEGSAPWDVVELGGPAMGTGIGHRSSVWGQLRRLPHWMRFASATLRSG